MTTTDRHVPTAEFRARLERRLARDLRGNRETENTGRHDWHRLKIAALLVAALGIGSVAGAASAQVQEARQKDNLLAAARAEVQLTGLRAELARTQAAATRRRHQVGAVGREVVVAAEAESQRMQAALARARLELEEIQASAAPPRDDLAAPLVKGRDFVKERMLLHIAAAEHELAAASAALAETESRNRLGLASGLVVLEARAMVTQSRAEIELLSQRLQLREEYLQGRIDAGTVALREQRLELTQAIRVAEELNRVAERRLTHVRERQRLGQADQIDVLRAELSAKERALELLVKLQQLAAYDEAARE